MNDGRPGIESAENPKPAKMRRWIGLAAGYVVVSAVVVGGLWYVRGEVIESLGSPQAVDEWNDWRDKVAEQQAEPDVLVRRRVPKSPEPPYLALMRDHFPAVLGVVWASATVFYFFIAVLWQAAFVHPGPGSEPKKFGQNG